MTEPCDMEDLGGFSSSSKWEGRGRTEVGPNARGKGKTKLMDCNSEEDEEIPSLVWGGGAMS